MNNIKIKPLKNQSFGKVIKQKQGSPTESIFRKNQPYYIPEIVYGGSNKVRKNEDNFCQNNNNYSTEKNDGNKKTENSSYRKADSQYKLNK